MAIVLYDDECGLCNRLVRFIHKQDARDEFRYAPLGGPTARRLLPQHGLPEDLADTVVVIDDDQATTKSDAALAIAQKLGAPWQTIATIGRLVPRRARDAAYELVARNRHRLFHDRACAAAEPALRERMLP